MTVYVLQTQNTNIYWDIYLYKCTFHVMSLLAYCYLIFVNFSPFLFLNIYLCVYVWNNLIQFKTCCCLLWTTVILFIGRIDRIHQNWCDSRKSQESVNGGIWFLNQHANSINRTNMIRLQFLRALKNKNKLWQHSNATLFFSWWKKKLCHFSITLSHTIKLALLFQFGWRLQSFLCQQSSCTLLQNSWFRYSWRSVWIL
jgi:hypothetical protein